MLELWHRLGATTLVRVELAWSLAPLLYLAYEIVRGLTKEKKMTMMVIFGGEDVESATARAVARAAGCVIATATTADGKKVHGGNAYQAVSYVVDIGDVADAPEVVIFECAPAAAGALRVVAQCDHHNPGDPGWGKGASQYWAASSLGQLCELLGVEPTPELRLVAAGDHSPAGAYRGLCSGVDPAEFAAWRIAGKVAFYATNPRTADKADADKIRAAIKAAKAVLAAAPLLDGVRDLRDVGEVDELPEAALSTGQAYMASLPDTDRERKPTGNTKIVFGGHATAENVQAFMSWAMTLANRVGEPYGNPDRGFAGVVVKLE